MDTIAAGGRTDTGRLQRVFWCALVGIVAAVLLASGGLAALQSMTITTALPFSIVMLVLLWSLFKGIRADLAHRHTRRHEPPPAHPAAGLSWQRRLAQALQAPTEAQVRAFIDKVVVSALTEVAAELTRRGRPAEVTRDEESGAALLTSPAEGVRPFVYSVQPAQRPMPAFSVLQTTPDAVRHEARTAFSDGSRGYDVMNLSREQLITDILVQFERYLTLVHTPDAALVTTAPAH